MKDLSIEEMEREIKRLEKEIFLRRIKEDVQFLWDEQDEIIDLKKNSRCGRYSLHFHILGGRAMSLTVKDRITAENNGINLNCVQTRLYHGWKKERAINEPMRIYSKRKKYIKLAASNGIGEGTFNSRIDCYGWEMERAATEPVNTQYRRKKMT